jgi:hypothetical protein
MCAALARNTFEGDLAVVNNCTHTGDEVDLLVVDVHSLKLIDVEVKVSRADLKADAGKHRWQRQEWRGPQVQLPRDWPVRVWKHYYAISADVWTPELLAYCRPKSGVLVVTATGKTPTTWSVQCVRRSKPNPDAQPIGLAELAQITRLATLRMWDAYSREFEKSMPPAAVEAA